MPYPNFLGRSSASALGRKDIAERHAQGKGVRAEEAWVRPRHC